MTAAKNSQDETQHEPCAEVKFAKAHTLMQWGVIVFLVALLGSVFGYYQGRLNTYEGKLAADHDTLVRLTSELPFIRQGVDDLRLTLGKITEIRTVNGKN